jgi:bifunctional non-homologous end joining protein LigD
MKAVSGDLPPRPEQPAWSFEIKWDGMRVVTCTDGAHAQLWSSNHIDVSRRFPELDAIAPVMGGRPAVFDGEVVAFDADSLPSFQVLQTRMHVDDRAEARRRAATVPVLYVVFDVMHFDGHDLTGLPLEHRASVLDEVFDEGDAWQRVARHDDGEALLDAVQARGLEGVMAKRRDSTYAPGRRSPAWRKVKVRRHAELVVGGWLPGQGARAGRLGALLVGFYEGDDLRFAGRVGSGLTDAEIDTLSDLLAPLARGEDPFIPRIKRTDAPGARFVEPRLVVEVAYGEWTSEGRLRHPSYLGRRFDKDPRDIGRP